MKLKNICFLILAVTSSVFAQNKKFVTSTKQINLAINKWHNAAATANYNDYFNLMTDNAIFIGTDATENWNKKAFEVFAKPHFDKGKAWAFYPLERNVFIDKTGKIAWFDELLDTSFKICRGSGVLEKTKNGWKISHYTLSFTIPNDISKEVVSAKSDIESALIKELKAKN